MSLNIWLTPLEETVDTKRAGEPRNDLEDLEEDKHNVLLPENCHEAPEHVPLLRAGECIKVLHASSQYTSVYTGSERAYRITALDEILGVVIVCQGREMVV